VGFLDFLFKKKKKVEPVQTSVTSAQAPSPQTDAALQKIRTKLIEKEKENKRLQFNEARERQLVAKLEADLAEVQKERDRLLASEKEHKKEWVKERMRDKRLKKLQAELEKKEKELQEREKGVGKGSGDTSDDMDDLDFDLDFGDEKEMPATKTAPQDDLEKERTRLEKMESELKKWEKGLRDREDKIIELEQESLGPEDKERQRALEDNLQGLTFDNFVIGPGNRFPREAAFMVAKSPSDSYNPLFIYSGVGLGKTHLLFAIGNYIRTHNPRKKVCYITSEKFINELINSTEKGKIEDFRNDYRDVDVLLLDDIQFISKQEATQEEFFHTFNTLYSAHKQIVMTSDRPPKEIETLEKRLRSRFEGGLITEIKPPDLNTRLGILNEKIRKENYNVPEEIVNFIATEITSNIRTLVGALNKVVAYSQLTYDELNLASASEILKDIIGKEKR